MEDVDVAIVGARSAGLAAAKTLRAAGEAAGIDFVVDRLCGIFGGEVRKGVGRAMMTNWDAERFVRGAYAAARRGRSQARVTLMQPVAAKIFFAGEHVAAR